MDSPAYIAIDGNEANIQNRVGSNVYAHQLLTYLHQVDIDTNYQIYLKSSKLSDLPQPNKNWHYHTFGPSKLWTQWRLPLELYRKNPKPKIFFTPGHYAPRLTPIPSVISIMDLAFHYFPQTFQPKTLHQLKSWTKYSINNATHIFTISQHSKQDIIKLYNYPADKITVTYPGSNITPPKKWNQALAQKIKTKFNTGDNYFIFIGTRQPRKNLDRLIQAFNQFHSTNQDYKLIIVGKTWHQFKDTNLKLNLNIQATGYVSDQDLTRLLLASKALIFPSLYEGFGIPVLEAMKLGTLVATSNTSSIPEITGKSPLLFNPKSTDQIANTLTKITQLKSDAKQKLINQGKIKAKQFTWRHCASQTKEVLHALAFS